MKSKIIAVVLSVSTLILCIPSGNAIADTSVAKNSKEYVFYSNDFVTGEEGYVSIPISDNIVKDRLSDNIFEGNSGEISPNAYIGEDDSYEIFGTGDMPYRAVCNLKTYWDNNGDGIADYISGGSGCMIGRRLLLTAGHVLYHNDGKDKCIGVDVYPAQLRYYTPWGPYKATKVFINGDYQKNSYTADDWGFVILDEYVGDWTGWLDLQNCSDVKMLGSNVSVIGYPQGKDNERISMWRSDGRVVKETDGELRYDCDTTGGCSGGPVINSDNKIVAVHHGGVSNAYNVGAKIDDLICRAVDVFNYMYNL